MIDPDGEVEQHDDTPMTEVLRALAGQGFTGVVRFPDAGAVWLAGGRIYLVEASGSDDLHAVIFGADVGNLADIEALLGEPNADVTAILAERFPASVPALGRLLHEHNLAGLFEVMVTAPAGHDTEVGVIHALGPRFAESVEDLVGQAERRLAIWREIAAGIPSTASRFRMAPELAGEGTERVVTADEWRYLALLGTGAPVSKLIDQGGESAFRVMTSLYRMLLEGMIAPAD